MRDIAPLQISLNRLDNVIPKLKFELFELLELDDFANVYSNPHSQRCEVDEQQKI
jgi:hypothetical protein